MNRLDTTVAQAVFRARQMERALHDSGPWTVVYGDNVLPADRQIRDDRVVFSAFVPEQCWLSAPESLSLQCGEDVVGVRRIPHPGDGAFVIQWEMALAEQSAFA